MDLERPETRRRGDFDAAAATFAEKRRRSQALPRIFSLHFEYAGLCRVLENGVSLVQHCCALSQMRKNGRIEAFERISRV